MENQGSSASADLSQAAEQARRLEREAEGFQEEARREQAHEHSPAAERTDYEFTLPDEIVAANRVRADDDAETAARQRDLAHGQRQAAETLQHNAEVLRQTAQELRRTQQGIAQNAEDVRAIAEDAQTLRTRTEQVQQAARGVGTDGAEDPRGDASR